MPKVLFVGDIHGEFNRLVEPQQKHEPDLCFQVGDLEPVRDEEDLRELTGPAKYNEIRDFPDYYSGDKKIPCKTYFIGGNHEPWSYLHQHNPNCGNDSELIANLNYLGRAGVTEIQRLTVAYLTGVYGETSYDVTSDKRVEFARGMNWKKNKRLGHFRKDEIARIVKQAKDREINILLTHCWPSPDELQNPPDWYSRNNYGIEVIGEIVELIKPRYHVAGHIHSSYEGVYKKTDTRFIGLEKAPHQNDFRIMEFNIPKSEIKI